MNQHEQPAKDSQYQGFPVQPDSPVSSSPLIEISAFPSSLKEQPWSRSFEIFLNTYDEFSFIRITWPRVQFDLDGLGQVEIAPMFLVLSLLDTELPETYSLLLYDHNQHELGVLSPGSSMMQPVSLFAENVCLLKAAKNSSLSIGKISSAVHVHLQTFRAALSLPSRNLWWMEDNEEQRKWMGDMIEYTNPSLLLADLGTNLERFIEEAGVIGYKERRRKLATLLFVLGRIAHAIEAYPQAIQFYGKSEQIFRNPDDKEIKEKILLILRDLFLRQGKKEQAKHVALRLLNLRASS